MSRNGGRLDTAIDRAAGAMLDVEPPAGLPGRVMHRLASPRRAPSWIWAAAPIAAATGIVLAVLVPWRHAARQPVPTAPRTAMAPTVTVPRVASSRVPAVAVPSPVSRDPPPQRAAVAASPGMLMTAMSPAGGAVSGIEPLTPIEPITVAAVRPADIEQKPIAISPLAPIAELQIAPLSPPARRN